MAKLTAAYPEKDYTNDQLFYNDGGMNNIKSGKYAAAWDFDTNTVGGGQLNLHTIVYKVAPVYIQVFKNGDTSKATDSIYVGKYKENHKIPEADVKAAFAAKNADNKLENFGLYYAQGNWNRFKDGLDATAWDFNGRTLLGYTNLFTMAYEKQTVKYYLSDELRTKGTKYAYASATGYKGLALENTAEDPVKEGYTFKYWAKEGQSTNYFTSGQKVNGWTNLVAKFKANEYKLKLTGNGGSYKADGKNQQIFETTVTYDSAYEIPEFTMNGYHFVGWSTDYHGENMVELGDVWNIAHDVELHAVWAPNTGIMNLYANGGTFEDGEAVKTVEFKVGDQYSKVIVNPTREGYRLAGWAYGTDKGASGNVGLSWNIGAKEKINLAAIWEPIETEE